jgi:hypothetical protein
MWCKWLRRVCKVIFSLRAMTAELCQRRTTAGFHLLFRRGRIGDGLANNVCMATSCRETLIIVRKSSSFFFRSVMSWASAQSDADGSGGFRTLR